jgi:nucleoside-diphosphate-sugar epimerase
VSAGHTVICVSRGLQAPRTRDNAWKQVTYCELDRQQEESDGTFGERIAKLDAAIVIDLICYELESAKHLVEALQGRVEHFLHCGTIWVHGPSIERPTTEDAHRNPFGDYGCRKADIEAYLLKEFRTARLPVTILHPGHLVGPGWAPINPNGNFNLQVFSSLAGGAEVLMPNFGMETVHHVHADDVGQAFVKAVFRRRAAIGESFHVVSPRALTLRGYAEQVAAWFGRAARLRFLAWDDWRRGALEKDVEITRDHLLHSPNCSIQKARNLLEYEPRFSSLEAIQESIGWLVQNRKLETT